MGKFRVHVMLIHIRIVHAVRPSVTFLPVGCSSACLSVFFLDKDLIKMSGVKPTF